MEICDLHTHSYFSDGTLSPEELVQQAEQAGLSAIALCDHNTVAGLPRFLKAGQGSPVRTIPGIEFSTDYDGTELHLIMLFVKPSDYGPITSKMEAFRQRKEESNRALVQALQQAGFRIDYDRMKKDTPDQYLNRAHIAAELTRQGYADSIKDAFRRYLAPGGGYYTPPMREDFFETVRFIRGLQGVAVLAHPFLNLTEEQLIRLLPKAAECGLQAMETMYSQYDPDTTRKAKNLAKRFGLLESGGSDFHGANKPAIHLGTGTGELQIPSDVIRQLESQYPF